MKKLLKVAILGGIILAASTVQAITVYYQPTPYADWMYNSTATNPKPMPKDIGIVHTWQGWLGNVYQKTIVRNEFLQIGGWGDTYVSLLKFDVNGLPANVDYAQLYLYAIPSGSANPSQVSIYRLNSDWNPATLTWGNDRSTTPFSRIVPGYYWNISTTVNAWRSYDIKGWYEGWKAGTYTNNGLVLMPYNNDGTSRFDKFVSVRASDSTHKAHRPMIMLSFTPSMTFRMPLPSGNWLVTTEIGGYDCKGGYPPLWPDSAHTNAGSVGNYFSIDIAAPTSTSIVPILAPAWGVVIFAGGNNNANSTADPNGFNATIDHDGDGNPLTGFQSRYLHLKNLPAHKDGTLLKVGEFVNTGDQIGLMGTTGYYFDSASSTYKPSSTGVHLHLGFRYQNKGYSFSNELSKVVMDGKLLKSYQTECSTNSSGVPQTWNRYYTSTNVPTNK